MASPADQGLPSEERPRSLAKFVRRASRILRPRPVNTSQPVPTSPTSNPMIISPVASPSPAAPLASHPTGAPTSFQQSNPRPSMAIVNTSQASDPEAVDIPYARPTDLQAHSKQQQEKAQAFFAKYGFTTDSQDWTPLSKQGAMQATWVEKKVRMRVHRECHKCHTSFGSSKVCISCDHVRCKSCPRFPPKKNSPSVEAPTQGMTQVEQEMEGERVADEQAPISSTQAKTVSLPVQQEKENLEPSDVGTGAPLFVAIDPIDDQNEALRNLEISRIHQRRGADVVYRAPQHRVRRLCHKCDTVFKGRSTECESCGHQRCPSCVRDPAKFSKFPEGFGYPGDVLEPEPTYPALERVWRKPRIRVRWTCHECNAIFVNSNEKVCMGCKHSRCELCPRDPPKKQPRQHPEELIRGLEGKLGGLMLSPSGQVEKVGMS